MIFDNSEGLGNMEKNIAYIANIITTATFYRDGFASVQRYVVSMAGDNISDQQDLRVLLHQLGFLTNANSNLMSLNWNVNARP